MSILNTPKANEVLAALDSATERSLFVHLQPIKFSMGEVIDDVGKYVYFPADCLIGQCNRLHEGAGGAVYLVGRDGMVGSAVLLDRGAEVSQFRVQCSGTAFRLPASELINRFDSHEGVRQVMLRVIHSAIAQMTKTAACNQWHSVEQQMCRWILMSLDLLPEHNWNEPQDLAHMLGLSHAEFREAAQQLEHLGAIERQKTSLVVMNRLLIEAMCCVCYIDKHTEKQSFAIDE